MTTDAIILGFGGTGALSLNKRTPRLQFYKQLGTRTFRKELKGINEGFLHNWIGPPTRRIFPPHSFPRGRLRQAG